MLLNGRIIRTHTHTHDSDRNKAYCEIVQRSGSPHSSHTVINESHSRREHVLLYICLHGNILSGFGLDKRLSITDKRNTFNICSNDSFSKISLDICLFVARHSRVKCVVLLRSGFQVVGGEISGRQDLGTIISSITPGGPADINGSLKPGMKVWRGVVLSPLILYLYAVL